MADSLRLPSRVPRWAFLPFIVVSAVHVVALFVDADAIAAPTKLALMPLLAFAVVVGGRGLSATAPLALLLIAQAFSWLGDGAGIFMPFLPAVPTMLACFGVAHLAYIVLFWRHLTEKRLPLWSIIFLAWWALLLFVIGPHTDGLLVPVAIYGLLLGLTATLASRTAPMIAIGAISFLASDTVLAFVLFVPEHMPAWTNGIVMLTYTLGQGLIAAGTLAALRRRAARRAEEDG